MKTLKTQEEIWGEINEALNKSAVTNDLVKELKRKVESIEDEIYILNIKLKDIEEKVFKLYPRN